jgi:hypothetical protein
MHVLRPDSLLSVPWLACRVYRFQESWPELIGTLVVTTAGRKAILKKGCTLTIAQQLAGLCRTDTNRNEGRIGARCAKADFLAVLQGIQYPKPGREMQLQSLLMQLLPAATETDLALLKVFPTPTALPKHLTLQQMVSTSI